MDNIFERETRGEIISSKDPEYYKIATIMEHTRILLSKLNNEYHSEKEVRELFFELTGGEYDDTFYLRPPFYTDCGNHIKVGKNVFINTCCTFLDRGGITIEDNVLIGPKVNLVTIDHCLEPELRHSTAVKPIQIKKNAWIGINATILGGVTIGENAIVGAGSVVTSDVSSNTIVAGNPAKIIKYINKGDCK